MREIRKQLTLQELRRMHKAASSANAEEVSPQPNKIRRDTAVMTAKTATSSTMKSTRSRSKAKGSAKVKSRSSKTPREFGCRKRAPAHGALVIPDGEEAGPLLLSTDPAKAATDTAVSAEIKAYRAATAAYQLKRLRGGLKRRSDSARSRDPRFSSLCGELNAASCSKAYSFVEDQQRQLMQQLQHVVKTGRMPMEEAGRSSGRGRKVTASEREQAEKQLQRLQSQQQQRERKTAEAALKASLSRTEREHIAATGKRPHYVSKKKLRELLREQQRQMSSNKKKIKQEIKQRKKALAKERKRDFVPQRRNGSGDDKG